MNHYNLGATIRIQGQFLDHLGRMVDPAQTEAVVFYPGKQSGTFVYGVDPEMKRLESGTYCVDLINVGYGVHLYKFYCCVSHMASSEEGEFFVE